MENAGVESMVIPHKLLQQYTYDFSKELGRGAFGVVYEGLDQYGKKIAVKKLDWTQGIDHAAFLSELKIMEKLRHQNIIRLVGYCSETEQLLVPHEGKQVVAHEIHRALCLEHMPKGSLQKLLSEGRDKYDWQTCYGIISGICHGLNYLHNESKPQIFHLDLKPANVLLDEKMVPRIADFGISKLIGEDEHTRVTKSVQGTLGYAPPEYINKGTISKKFDIFSLGVVILKMLAGLKGYEEMDHKPSDEYFDKFTTTVVEYWTNRILEPWHQRKEHSEQVKECIKFGLRCVENDRDKRPTIREIVDILKKTETDCTVAAGKELKSTSEVAIRDMLDGPARLMLVSNLDYAMVDDDEDKENLSLLRFGALWESAYRHDSLLVYSTGRSPDRCKLLMEQKPMLPTPDITITSLGTEITYGKDMIPDDGWEKYLDNRWDRDIVFEETKKFSGLHYQEGIDKTEQRPHKVSFNVEKEFFNAQELMDSLPKKLRVHDVDVNIIYSNGQFIDIIAKGAGKGKALAYLRRKLGSFGKTPKDTLVCGDTASDAELFSISDVYGVKVNNAKNELVKWYKEGKDNPKVMYAHERCAAGIIQAIGYFKLGPNVSPRDVKFPYIKVDSFKPTAAVVKFYVLYEKWRRGDVPKADSYFKSVTDANGVIIQPSGHVISIHSSIDACYADKQGKQYRSWVDRLGISQTASDSCLVRFDFWESSEGDERVCCLTTLALNVKPETPEGFVVTHIHMTRRASQL